jgi:hypothetical protein
VESPGLRPDACGRGGTFQTVTCIGETRSVKGVTVTPLDNQSEERKGRIKLGDDAVRYLQKHEDIHRWREVGIAANDLQAAAMEAGRTNKPVGKAYNKAWAELAQHVPNLRDLNKTSRAHAMWLATEWETVQGWLETVDHEQRWKMHHPTVVFRRYQAAQKPKVEKEDKAPGSYFKDKGAISIAAEIWTACGENTSRAVVSELQKWIADALKTHAREKGFAGRAFKQAMEEHAETTPKKQRSKPATKISEAEMKAEVEQAVVRAFGALQNIGQPSSEPTTEDFQVLALAKGDQVLTPAVYPHEEEKEKKKARREGFEVVGVFPTGAEANEAARAFIASRKAS